MECSGFGVRELDVYVATRPCRFDDASNPVPFDTPTKLDPPVNTDMTDQEDTRPEEAKTGSAKEPTGEERRRQNVEWVSVNLYKRAS